MNPVAALLLLVVYGAVLWHQLAHRGPPVWVVFALGALAAVLLSVLTPEQAWSALSANARVLFFLFGLFVMAADLERSGALHRLANWVLAKARRPRDLPMLLFLGFGIASTVLVNDALVLLGVPLLFALARRIGAPVKPLLLTLAFAVTVGSTLTPLGNPQNLLVSLSSGLKAPTAVFLRYLLVPTAVNLVLGALLVRRWFGPAFETGGEGSSPRPREAPPLFPSGGWRARLLAHPALAVFPGTVLLVVTFDLLATLTGGPTVPSVDLVMVGALLVLLLAPHRRTLVRRVNWTVLALFAGLFVVVAGAGEGGVIAALQSQLSIPPAAHPSLATVPSIVLTAAVGSQLVSNVPWAALQVPVLHGLGYGAGTPVAWMALAAATTLAGNLTLLGAASNLIVAQEPGRRGDPIGLQEFARYGVPMAAVTLLVVLVALWVGA